MTVVFVTVVALLALGTWLQVPGASMERLHEMANSARSPSEFARARFKILRFYHTRCTNGLQRLQIEALLEHLRQRQAGEHP